MPKNIRIFYYNNMDIYIYIYHGKSSLSKTCFNHHTPKILLHGCIKYQATYYKERSKQFVFAIIKFAIASKAMRCIFDI